jgi:hypothetical protein
MTNTRLLQKKSKRGEALVLTVAVIGLALIVTAAAFLLAARTGQDTERVASAKVDIANREDALMREILQQSAQGMLPGTTTPGGVNWTTIMTNAVTNLEATSYVDPTEVSTLLGPNAVIPANTGDTGGTSLAIFQGYQQEIPWGGTSGLANLVNAANTTSVQPPQLFWVPNANISATAATTYPQQFFLGSQMSAYGTSSTSPSGRWSSIPYPNIRFGLMRPGSSMVSRRVWWRIPVLYQTAQTAVEAPGMPRFPAAPANYILSIYEIPSQLPITGNANIQLGLNSDGSAWGDTTSAGNQVQITGSIYGDAVQLDGGTYSGGISSRRQVNVAQASSVAGENFTDNTYNNLGVREQKDLTRRIGAAPVSVAGDNGKALLVPLLPGQDFYLPASGSYLPATTPTAWDLYARPYFHCRLRVMISGTLSDPNSDSTQQFNYSGGQINTTGNTGAITVTVNYLPDTAGLPDAVFGVPDAPLWTTKVYQQANNLGGTGNLGSNGILQIMQNGIPVNSNFLIYTSTNTGNPSIDANILEIDLLKMFSILGLNPCQCYSIYIGCPPSQNPNNNAPLNLGVVIMDAADLSAFTNGLSIVTPQRLYLTGNFNTGGIVVPTSLYAADLRYGIDGVPAQLNLTGQVSISQVTQNSSTAVNPLNFVNGANVAITGAGNTYQLNAITNPKGLPPITRMNLLFTIDKERTN